MYNCLHMIIYLFLPLKCILIIHSVQKYFYCMNTYITMNNTKIFKRNFSLNNFKGIIKILNQILTLWGIMMLLILFCNSHAIMLVYNYVFVLKDFPIRAIFDDYLIMLRWKIKHFVFKTSWNIFNIHDEWNITEFCLMALIKFTWYYIVNSFIKYFNYWIYE